MLLIRRGVRVIASAVSMLTVRSFSLTAALVLSFILGIDVVCDFVADDVLGEGVAPLIYVTSLATWVIYAIERKGDEVQATAAADRRVVLARLERSERPSPRGEQ